MRLIDADYLKTWFGEKDLYTYDYIIGTIDDAPTVKAEPKLFAEVKIDKEDLEDLVAEKIEEIKEAISNTSNALKPLDNTEMRWIPCSERLPELDDEVLVTDDRGELRHCIFCTLGETWCGFITYEEGMRIIATAWMPLPEPYKERKEQ